MSEREHDASQLDADRENSEVEQSRSDPPAEQTEAGRPTDQAISNEERALESGEENVV